MRLIKPLTLSVSVCIASFSGMNKAWADNFNDAVNLYLKGFDSCSAAKSALSSGNVSKARSEFLRYEKHKKQASAIDPSILNTNKRGMDSNLKYCNRVGTDIELEIGRPILEKAFAACDQASDQLKQGQVETAKAQYQEFVTLRDQALETAPSINDVFSLRSKIRRCERTEKKIASAGQQQAELALTIQSAVESSEAFSIGCNATLKEANNIALSDAAIASAKKSLQSVQSSQVEANQDIASLKALKPGTPEQAKAQSNLTKGNQCLSQLTSVVSNKENQLQSAKQSANSLMAKLDRANASCNSVTSLKTANQAQYDKAKASYESARRTRSQVKTSMAKTTLPNDATADRLNGKMASLNRCLNEARPQLSKMLAALTPKAAPAVAAAPVVAVPAGAAAAKATTAAPKPKAEPKAKAIPPLELNGTIQIDDILPDFAIIYWNDDSGTPESSDVTLTPSSFNQEVYFLEPGGELKIRSEDFATHQIEASVTGNDRVQTKIRSRQRKTLKTNWPANSIAVMRSNQTRVEQSYIVNITSKHYNLVNFDSDDEAIKVSLSNPKSATKGFLLIPEYDALAFELSQGENKKLTLTRDGTPVGSMTLTGQ